MEENMVFKVGDKVKIKENLSSCTHVDPDGSMCRWQGEVMTIRNCVNSAFLGTYYKMQEDVETVSRFSI